MKESHLPRGRCGLKYAFLNESGLQSSASPSARKVWIEMSLFRQIKMINFESPSARKVWIEILIVDHTLDKLASPSARKVWIEIPLLCKMTND